MDNNFTQGFWNRLKANWYKKGLRYSSLPKTAMCLILPKAKDCRTFLDVGAGCGTLSMPLAKAGKLVTALDPSHAMIEILRDDIKKGAIRSIRTVEAAWGETALKPHDALLCSNVPVLLSEPEKFLAGAQALAKKAVFIIENAGTDSDKFYYRELYPLIFNRPFGKRTDYMKTYSALHSMGVLANVEIFEYGFDQPFDSIEEALDFWKEYMGIVTEEHDGKLRDFLSGKLVRQKGQLFAKFTKRSALIWWRKRPLKPAGKPGRG